MSSLEGDVEERERATQVARSCLESGVSALTGDAAVERRHEALMEWAESDLGLERGYAEQVYALAEEEELEPVHALLLVHCNVGVRELELPEADADEAAHQEAPPEWVGPEQTKLGDVALERRLRSTFRRFRTHLAEAGSAAAAVAAFMDEPDVGAVQLR
jgi:hypothetical protein